MDHIGDMQARKSIQSAVEQVGYQVVSIARYDIRRYFVFWIAVVKQDDLVCEMLFASEEDGTPKQCEPTYRTDEHVWEE